MHFAIDQLHIDKNEFGVAQDRLACERVKEQETMFLEQQITPFDSDKNRVAEREKEENLFLMQSLDLQRHWPALIGWAPFAFPTFNTEPASDSKKNLIADEWLKKKIFNIWGMYWQIVFI